VVDSNDRDRCVGPQILPEWRYPRSEREFGVFAWFGLLNCAYVGVGDRAGEARDELHRMLSEDELRDAVCSVRSSERDQVAM
jgi:hypothetical protein